jgi:hypothetical protein
MPVVLGGDVVHVVLVVLLVLVQIDSRPESGLLGASHDFMLGIV